MRDAQASLRLPADLKRDIQRVASAEARPLSSTLELLLRLGLTRYRQTQRLVERTARDRNLDDPLENSLLTLIDDMPKDRQEDVLTYVRALHSTRAATDPDVKSIKKSGRRAA